MYSVVFSRGDKLPMAKDFVLLLTSENLSDVKRALEIDGDLLIYSDSLEIVTDKEWAWSDYQRRMIENQKKVDSVKISDLVDYLDSLQTLYGLTGYEISYKEKAQALLEKYKMQLSLVGFNTDEWFSLHFS